LAGSRWIRAVGGPDAALAGRASSAAAKALAVVNQLAERCPLTIRLSPELVADYVFSRDDPVGALAATCARELAQCDPSRIKVCERSECHRYFYDTTRNRSACWHAEDPCGWRMRAERRSSEDDLLVH